MSILTDAEVLEDVPEHVDMMILSDANVLELEGVPTQVAMDGRHVCSPSSACSVHDEAQAHHSRKRKLRGSRPVTSAGFEPMPLKFPCLWLTVFRSHW